MQYLHDVLDGNLYHQDDAETQSQGSARTKRSLPWQGFDDTHSAGSNHSQDLGGFGDLTEHSLPKDPSPGELPALPDDVYAMAGFIGILDAWTEMQNEVVIGSSTLDSLRGKYTNLIDKVKHLRDWMKQSSEKCALYSDFIFKIHTAGSNKLQENVRITDIQIDEAILEVVRMFNKERERYNYYHFAHSLVWRYATVLGWVLEYTYLTQVLGGNFKHPQIDYTELHKNAVELFELIEHYIDTYRTEMEEFQKIYHEGAVSYFQSWQEELSPMVEVIYSTNKDLYDRFDELYSHGQNLDNLYEFSPDEENQVKETRDELTAWEEESRIASEEARMKKEASQVISTEEIIEYHTKALDIRNKQFVILRRQRDLLQSIHRKHLHNLQTRAFNIISELEEDIGYINNAVIRNKHTVDYLVALFARTADEEFNVASVQESCSFINNELERIDNQYNDMIEEEFNLKTRQNTFHNMASEIIRVEKKMVNIVNNFIHENNIKANERAHLIRRLADEKRDLIELLEARPALVPMALEKYEELIQSDTNARKSVVQGQYKTNPRPTLRGYIEDLKRTNKDNSSQPLALTSPAKHTDQSLGFPVAEHKLVQYVPRNWFSAQSGPVDFRLDPMKFKAPISTGPWSDPKFLDALVKGHDTSDAGASSSTSTAGPRPSPKSLNIAKDWRSPPSGASKLGQPLSGTGTASGASKLGQPLSGTGTAGPRSNPKSLNIAKEKRSSPSGASKLDQPLSGTGPRPNPKSLNIAKENRSSPSGAGQSLSDTGTASGASASPALRKELDQFLSRTITKPSQLTTEPNTQTPSYIRGAQGLVDEMRKRFEGKDQAKVDKLNQLAAKIAASTDKSGKITTLAQWDIAILKPAMQHARGTINLLIASFFTFSAENANFAGKIKEKLKHRNPFELTTNLYANHKLGDPHPYPLPNAPNFDRATDVKLMKEWVKIMVPQVNNAMSELKDKIKSVYGVHDANPRLKDVDLIAALILKKVGPIDNDIELDEWMTEYVANTMQLPYTWNDIKRLHETTRPITNFRYPQDWPFAPLTSKKTSLPTGASAKRPGITWLEADDSDSSDDGSDDVQHIWTKEPRHRFKDTARADFKGSEHVPVFKPRHRFKDTARSDFKGSVHVPAFKPRHPFKDTAGSDFKGSVHVPAFKPRHPFKDTARSDFKDLEHVPASRHGHRSKDRARPGFKQPPSFSSIRHKVSTSAKREVDAQTSTLVRKIVKEPKPDPKTPVSPPPIQYGMYDFVNPLIDGRFVCYTLKTASRVPETEANHWGAFVWVNKEMAMKTSFFRYPEGKESMVFLPMEPNPPSHAGADDTVFYYYNASNKLNSAPRRQLCKEGDELTIVQAEEKDYRSDDEEDVEQETSAANPITEKHMSDADTPVANKMSIAQIEARIDELLEEGEYSSSDEEEA